MYLVRKNLVFPDSASWLSWDLPIPGFISAGSICMTTPLPLLSFLSPSPSFCFLSPLSLPLSLFPLWVFLSPFALALIAGMMSWFRASAFFSKLIYRFNTTPAKIPSGFFTENDKTILKNRMEMQETQNSTTILKKKNKVRLLTLSDFKTYYKSIIINTQCCCHKERHVNQWNRLELQSKPPHL